MAPAVAQGTQADRPRPARRVGIAGGAPTQRDRLVAAMGELIGRGRRRRDRRPSRLPARRRSRAAPSTSSTSTATRCFVDAHRGGLRPAGGPSRRGGRRRRSRVGGPGGRRDPGAARRAGTPIASWRTCAWSRRSAASARDDGAAPRGDRPDRRPARPTPPAQPLLERAGADRRRSAACGSWRCAA